MPINHEGQRGLLGRQELKLIWDKWKEFLKALDEERQNLIELTFQEAAIIFGISEARLRDLSGGYFGIEINNKGVSVRFFQDVDTRREAYRVGAGLLQLAVQGQAEDYWRQLQNSNPDLVNKLSAVPGFSDLVESVISGASPLQEEETIFRHLRLASWFASLPPGKQEGLIRPEQIFTRPG